ncbi:MAG: hypothetical protein B9S33_16905 [Pedosphaera sp. Tous-C6FEB]|nr:MAG: hypothetical protein B9S33_16905 [Pedosphaera sp. Tous-C6FEB]
MKFRSVRFNSYFILLVAACLTACESTNPSGANKAASDVATLRIHLETHPDPILSRPIVVGRETPQTFSVTQAQLSEQNLVAARVLEGADEQFAIHLQFDRDGGRILEMLSMSYRGKRLAVGGQFPEPRWIGTFRMDRRIADGTLLFRPDATREEAGKMVQRLNNTVAKLKKSKD